MLLCVNMQTSFMHPPFGFALFYLRGIAPKEVRSPRHLLGRHPLGALQLMLVAVVIFWPESVTYWIEKSSNLDPATIRIELPKTDSGDTDAPALNFR